MKQNAFLTVCLTILFAACLSTQALSQSIVAAGYTFSASQKTFTYLSGGTSLPDVEVDDGYEVISIFPFRFCGNTYTDLVLCSNGWMKFGTQPTFINLYMNSNENLSQGQYPCIYPLYEDISGDIVGTSSYQITGTYPNRVFVWECRDFKWNYDATTASVSFQVWLYEATGVIECLYKQENGTVSVGSSGGATIGIANSITDWQTLDLASAAPTSSSTTYTYNITSRPATGQSYIWDPGPPCALPITPAITFVNSTSADISWTAPTGALGYEYFIDENPTPPTTGAPTAITATNVNATALKPGTVYYLHVRSKCGTYNFSSWVSFRFETLPPCAIPPPGINKLHIDSNSAKLAWQGGSTFLEYEYFLKTDATYPTSAVGATATTNNGLNLNKLISGKTYYIFLRVKCQGNDSSGWLLDSFYVPYPCNAPNVKFDNLNSGRVVAYWDSLPSAYEYEILNSTANIDPYVGIKVQTNSYHMPFLDAGKTYYVYARSHCDDRGLKSTSKWSETTFTTWPLDIGGFSWENEVFTIYPNPVKDKIIISRDRSNVLTASISLFDVNGKNISTVPFVGQNVEMDVSKLPHGTYILRYTDNVSTKHSRFTKQ